MFRMASASGRREVWRTRSTFQLPVYSSINSDTCSRGAAPRRPTGFIVKVLGIQGSFQIDVEEPSPIRWISPVSKAFLPAMIALQVEEARLRIEAWRKFECGQYLLFNTREHKEFGLVRRRPPCLSSIGRLNNWGSRKPIPPLIFGSVSLSH